jgi:broad specificity phosphatase PhoE
MDQMQELSVQAEVDKQVPTDTAEEKPLTGPPVKRQHLIVMRHGQRIDEIDKAWSASAERPFDPYLTPKGEEEAKAAAANLKPFNIEKVYVSPFWRCLQTCMFATAGLDIPPEKITVTTLVSEFLNPWIMVKKGGTLPEGNINNWFWEKGNMRDSLTAKLPPEVGSKVQWGLDTFKRYPENLLNSRARYAKAFQTLADEADGANTLIVTHGDGVNASVTRLIPWALVYSVKHTGFTVAYRDQAEDGTWGGWVLESKSGEHGVSWNNRLKPAFDAYSIAGNVAEQVAGVYSRWAPSWAPFRSQAEQITTPTPPSPVSKPQA